MRTNFFSWVRKEEFERIVFFVRNNVSVFVKGDLGSGKTVLLERVREEFPNALFFDSFNFCLSDLQKYFGEGRKKELLRKLVMGEFVILIDNASNLSRNRINFLVDLLKNNTLVVAGEVITEELSVFFEVVVLHPLNHTEIKRFINALGVKNNKIIVLCRGNLLKARRLCEKFNLTGRVEVISEGVNLRALAYSMLSLRYAFMLSGLWGAYRLISMIAYALLSLTRFKKK